MDFSDIKLILKVCLAAILILLVFSCQKQAGPGGKAMISGKVYVKNFDSYGMNVMSEYYGSGESVYIIYGSNTAVGNSVKTSIDGSFQFLYLNKGHYKIF